MASQAFRLSLSNWRNGHVHLRVMRKRTIGGGLLLCYYTSPGRLGIAHYCLCFNDLRRPSGETKSDTPSSLGVATQRDEGGL